MGASCRNAPTGGAMHPQGRLSMPLAVPGDDPAATLTRGRCMSRPGKLVIVGVVVLALALGGGFLLFVNRTSDSPPPAALDPAPTTTAGAATGSTQAQADGVSSPDGTWQVSDNGSSYVGYRVKEQLASLTSPNDAVGRSK